MNQYFVYHKLWKVKIDLEKFSLETGHQAQRLHSWWLLEFDCEWHGSLWRSSYHHHDVIVPERCAAESWGSCHCSSVCCMCLQTLRRAGTAVLAAIAHCSRGQCPRCVGLGQCLLQFAMSQHCQWPGMTGQVSEQCCSSTLPVIQTAELGLRLCCSISPATTIEYNNTQPSQLQFFTSSRNSNSLS